MLNTVVPYEINTIHSERYNYKPILEQSPARTPSPSTTANSADIQSRRGSEIIAEDEHCVTLAEPVPDAPPVIVFFSFLDEHSKKWAIEHEVVQTIRRNVPQGTTISRYHAPMQFSWKFGEELTHAWAVAKALQVDDRLITPMFQAVYNKRVHDLEGIRIVFDEVGIDPLTLLREWATPKALREKDVMDKAVTHLDLSTVPGILVKGKYMVKLDTYEQDFSAERACRLVKKLLARE